LLPIPPSSATLEPGACGLQKNEPCPQTSIAGTILTRGQILCCVLGERVAVLQQEKESYKSNGKVLRACDLRGIEKLDAGKGMGKG
jgi:hypothetical protein